MVGSEGPTDANQAWRRPLPRIGARVEVMVVGAKPGPRAKYGVGVVSGIDWDSVFRTWRVVVRFDEPAGTYYGGPIRTRAPSRGMCTWWAQMSVHSRP